jgi:uncharacterized protein YuzE
MLRRDTSVAKTVRVDEPRNVDLDAHGGVIAIEILWASEGIALDDIVERFRVQEIRDDLYRVSQRKFLPTVRI